MTRPKGHCVLAARLLDEVLRKSDWRLDTIAHALGLTESQVEEYRRGAIRMPVEQRLELAAIVLDQIPECAPTARRLIGQASAEAMFLRKETTTHMVAPPAQWR